MTIEAKQRKFLLEPEPSPRLSPRRYVKDRCFLLGKLKRPPVTTAHAINNLKPEATDYKVSAGQGMFLLVRPSGAKAWRLKYQFNGKQRQVSLGTYPEVGLAAARRLRDESRQQIALGNDPVELARAARAEALTFGEVAERWYTANTTMANKPWAASTAGKVRLYLDKDVLPTFGHRPIAEIKRPELYALNDAIEARGALETARKVRRWLADIFEDAFDKEEIPENPAVRLKAGARGKGAESSNHPTVPFSELAELLAQVEQVNTAIANKLAIRVMLLTAVRPSELRLAKWQEFDLAAQTWVIPAKRMKMRKEHVVPLPRQAVAALHELQQLALGSEYVLPSRSGKPISDATINKVFKTAGYAGRQTGHGFRHLLSTELNERAHKHGYSSDWIEAQLAHKTAESDKDKGMGADRGTYNHAAYLEPRRAMMQEWADSIDALLAGAGEKE